jgi:hypothetical protein
MSGAAIFAFFVVPLSALVLAYLAVLWHEHDVIWYGRHSVITNQPHTRSDTQAPDSHAKPAHDGQGDVSARETHLRSATNSVKPTMGAELGTFGVVTAALLRRRPRAVAVGGAAGEPPAIAEIKAGPVQPKTERPEQQQEAQSLGGRIEIPTFSRRPAETPPSDQQAMEPPEQQQDPVGQAPWNEWIESLPWWVYWGSICLPAVVGLFLANAIGTAHERRVRADSNYLY